MDYLIELVSLTFTTDELHQRVPHESRRPIWAHIQSVSRAEWFQGGQNGLKPEYKVTMFAPDYSGQQEVEYKGIKYGIYRTYLRQDELLELYLERKTGV